jgi:hypothetical protein
MFGGSGGQGEEVALALLGHYVRGELQLLEA